MQGLQKGSGKDPLEILSSKGVNICERKTNSKTLRKKYVFSMMQRVRTDIIKKKLALRDQSAIRVSVAFGQLLPQKYRKIALVTAAMQQVPEIKYQ